MGYSNDEEEESVKRESPVGKAINMDGIWHSVGNKSCCGTTHYPQYLGGVCECGGIIHSQAIYGPAIYYECDQCGETWP